LSIGVVPQSPTFISATCLSTARGDQDWIGGTSPGNRPVSTVSETPVPAEAGSGRSRGGRQPPAPRPRPWKPGATQSAGVRWEMEDNAHAIRNDARGPRHRSPLRLVVDGGHHPCDLPTMSSWLPSWTTSAKMRVVRNPEGSFRAGTCRDFAYVPRYADVGGACGVAYCGSRGRRDGGTGLLLLALRANGRFCKRTVMDGGSPRRAAGRDFAADSDRVSGGRPAG